MLGKRENGDGYLRLNNNLNRFLCLFSCVFLFFVLNLAMYRTFRRFLYGIPRRIIFKA